MGEVFLDAFVDTVIVLPFLFAIYVLLEGLEHGTSISANGKILQGNFAPLIGSAAGLVPLCGFSVMAAKLYDDKKIKAGTLLSVFIATSDEAVIILASGFSVRALQAILWLLLIKFVLAVIIGYAVNAAINFIFKSPAPVLAEPIKREHAEGESKVKIYFLNPLWRALKIALYLFAVNIAFGLLIYFVGEEKITSSLEVGKFLQPLITAAVGLIPSCASSVIIADAYLRGIITFGSMLSGLVVNAGMGFVVLFKSPSKWKNTLFIILTAFAASYLCGIAFNSIPYFNGLI